MRRLEKVFKYVTLFISIYSFAILVGSWSAKYYYAARNDSNGVNMVIASTNIVMGVGYIGLSIFSLRTYAYIKPFNSLNQKMFQGTKIMSIQILTFTVCYLIYSIFIILEGAFDIALGDFYFTCCVQGQVYLAPWWLELVYLVVQCLPMFGLTFMGIRQHYKDEAQHYNVDMFDLLV